MRSAVIVLPVLALVLGACGDQTAANSQPAPVVPAVQPAPAAAQVPVRPVASTAEVHAATAPQAQAKTPVSSTVTGAIVHEASIREVITVDPAGAIPTLAAGIQAALKPLAQGIPTKLVVKPGIYREAIDGQPFKAAGVADTLLVIEAAAGGPVVWTGSDLVPETDWKDEGGNLWSVAWTENWGNFTYPWGEPLGIGPRREMLFIDGVAARPVALEEYQHTGAKDFPQQGDKLVWTRTGTKDPAKALAVNQFGVVDDQQRLWVKLPTGRKPTGIEVAKRATLLDISGKRWLVLRGITFQHCANGHQEMYSQAPVRVGHGADEMVGDILVDRCRFVWNSTMGIALRGWRWTLRDSQFDYNGNSGISGNHVRDLLFERCSTSYNCWREFLAGKYDWNFGGFKMHEVEGHLVRDHIAIGNADHGMWWDVWCKDVVVDGAICVFNRRSFIYELSWGPFLGRRILAASGLRVQAMKSDKPTEENLDVDAVAIISCSSRAVVESSVLWTETAPFVFGINWYERDNEHGKMHTSIAGLHELKRSVIAGGGTVKWLVAEDNVGDRKGLGYRALQYRGTDNLFWHAGGKVDVFRFADVNWTRQSRDLSAWSQVRPETGGSIADPQFLDPANGDFRVAPTSPLAGRTDLPLMQVDPKLIKQARDFYAWIGWPNLPTF